MRPARQLDDPALAAGGSSGLGFAVTGPGLIVDGGNLAARPCSELFMIFPIAADEPETATIGAATFLSVSGQGPPGTDDFYARKAELRAAAEQLGHPGPIEILYWFDPGHGDIGITSFYWTVPLEHLRWRMLVRVPDGIRLQDELANAGLSLFVYTEGKVVQVMHHGPFAGEDETMKRLGAYADSLGLRRNGPHHEIHLDAFGPTTPQDDFRTILRDPVA